MLMIEDSIFCKIWNKNISIDFLEKKKTVKMWSRLVCGLGWNQSVLKPPPSLISVEAFHRASQPTSLYGSADQYLKGDMPQLINILKVTIISADQYFKGDYNVSW